MYHVIDTPQPATPNQGPVGRSERVPGRGDVARRPWIPRRHGGAVVERVARRRRLAEPPDRLHVRRRLPRVVHGRAVDPAGAGWPGSMQLALSHLGRSGRAAGWPVPVPWKASPTWCARCSPTGGSSTSPSLTHPMLTQVSATQLRAEVDDSRTELQRSSASRSSVFCYPYGDHDAATVKAVESAGYVAALGANLGLASAARARMRSTASPSTAARAWRASGPCCAATACRSRVSAAAGRPSRFHRCASSSPSRSRIGSPPCSRRPRPPTPACVDPGREPALTVPVPRRRRP